MVVSRCKSPLAPPYDPDFLHVQRILLSADISLDAVADGVLEISCNVLNA